MQVTRRRLAATLAIAAAGKTENRPASAEPQQPSPPDLLQTARNRMKAASDALAKEQIPMSTEPAVVFHAE
jgi:hypothetical protein